jgi:pyruvate dehydrogenase E2 component (dihydrolipoamide acetyltransferase)
VTRSQSHFADLVQVTFRRVAISLRLSEWRFQHMRKILFVAATALLCQAAYAEDAVAPAPPPPPLPPTAAPAPAAAAPAAPAPATAAAPEAAPAAPATAAAPDAAPKTATKPVKKKAARGGGRNYQSDEARARAIASKYGVTW